MQKGVTIDIGRDVWHRHLTSGCCICCRLYSRCPLQRWPEVGHLRFGWRNFRPGSRKLHLLMRQMRNISTRRQFAYTHFVAHMLLGQQGSCSLMITTYTFPKFECHDEFSFQLGLLLGVVVRNMTACSRNASFPHTQWELNQDTQLSDHLWMSWLWCDLRFICRICVYIIESLKKSMTSRCTGSHMTDDANRWGGVTGTCVWSEANPLSLWPNAVPHGRCLKC